MKKGEIDQLINDLLDKKKIGMVIRAEMNVLDNDENIASVDAGIFINASIDEIKIIFIELFRSQPELLLSAGLAFKFMGMNEIGTLISSISNDD